MKYFVIFILAVIMFSTGFGQSGAFYNVNASGDLSFSMPLITVPGRGGLNFDINLSYSAGIKVDYQASWVGLGWNLKVGRITRVPRGYSDSQFCDFASVPEVQPDMYIVILPNGGGTMFPVEGTGTDPHFVFSDHRAWKVEVIINNPVRSRSQSYPWYTDQADFEEIIITTENGTRYRFGLPLLKTIFKYSDKQPYDYQTYVGNWLLTGIESANYKDEGSTGYDEDDKGNWIRIKNDLGDPSDKVDTYKFTDNSKEDVSFPAVIETPTHRLKLERSLLNRNLEVPLLLSHENDPDGAKVFCEQSHRVRLEKIDLFSKTGSTESFIKGWKFNHGGYSGGGSFVLFPSPAMPDPLNNDRHKLTLNSFYMYTQNEQLPPFKITYNSLNNGWNYLDAGTYGNADYIMPKENFVDDWGYYKPGENLASQPWAWSVKSITTPQGLTVEYDFESDVFTGNIQTFDYMSYNSVNATFSNQNVPAISPSTQGGLRVKKVDYKHNSTIDKSVFFTYGEARLTGVPLTLIKDDYDSDDYYFSGDADHGQNWIIYDKITETFKDVAQNDLGYTEYYYTTDLLNDEKYKINQNVVIKHAYNSSIDYYHVATDDRSFNWGRLYKTINFKEAGYPVSESVISFTDTLMAEKYMMHCIDDGTRPALKIQSYMAGFTGRKINSYADDGTVLVRETLYEQDFETGNNNVIIQSNSDGRQRKTENIFQAAPTGRSAAVFNGDFNDVPAMYKSGSETYWRIDWIKVPRIAGWTKTSPAGDPDEDRVKIYRNSNSLDQSLQVNAENLEGQELKIESEPIPIVGNRNYNFYLKGIIHSEASGLSQLQAKYYAYDKQDNCLNGTGTEIYNQSISNNHIDIDFTSEKTVENNAAYLIIELYFKASSGNDYVQVDEIAVLPGSINATAGGLAYKLAAGNVLALPYQKKIYENATLKNYQEYEFYDYDPAGDVDNIRLQRTYLWNDLDADNQVDAGEKESRGEALAYDAFGNVVETQDVRGLSTLRLYGYNSSRGVADVVNASEGEAFVDDFENGPQGWTEESGAWNPEYGEYSAEITSGNAIALLSSDQVSDVIIETMVNSKDSGPSYNGFIIFGYQNQSNFKYAGMYEDANRWSIGQFSGGSKTDLINYNETVDSNQDYKLRVVVKNGNVELYVDNDLKCEYDFGESPVGNVGLLTISAHSHFDNVRMYPADALCNSVSYDSNTLRPVSATSTDGNTVNTVYDELGRVVQTRDEYDNILSEKSYFLSRELNTDYNENDPNFVRSVNYAFTTNENKHANLVSNYSFELDHTGTSIVPSMWQCNYPSNCDIVSKDIVSQCVKLWYGVNLQSNFIAVNEGKTYYLKALMKKDALSDMNFGISWYDKDYEPLSQDLFYYWLNRTWQEKSEIVIAPANACYGRIEIQQGHSYLYVDEVILSESAENMQIQAGISTVYSNHLGQTFQSQFIKYNAADEKYKMVVNGSDFDEMGRVSRTYLPLELTENDVTNFLDYVNDYASQVNTTYPQASQRPFQEFSYRNNFSKAKDAGYIVGYDNNYYTSQNYYTNSADDVSGYTAQSLSKNSTTDRSQGGNAILHDSYTDYFGNVIKSVQDVGGLNIETNFEYDIGNKLLRTTKEINRDYENLQPQKTSSDQEDMREHGEGTLLQIGKMDSDCISKNIIVSMNFSMESEPAEASITYILEYLQGDAWVRYGEPSTLEAAGVSGSDQHIYNNSIFLDKEAVCVRVTDISPEDREEFMSFTFKLETGWKLNLANEVGNLISEYTYNTLGQMTKEDVPDKGVTDYLYDQNGNIRFIQDEKHKSIGKMIYHQYDQMNRLLEIGVCWDKDQESFTIDYFTEEYAYGQLPLNITSSNYERVKYVYDEGGHADARNLAGKPAQKIIKNNDGSSSVWYSYNEKGRLEWIIQSLAAGIEKKIEYLYDLSGRINKMIYDNGGEDQLYYFYEYGPTGALQAVYTNTIDDLATAGQEIKYNAGNAAGQLTQIILGENTQTVDYEYDPLYGWLNRINNPDLLGDDKFAMALYHNDTQFGGTAYYNGVVNSCEYSYPTISGISKKHHRYDFTYDALLQMKSATYYYKFGTSWVSGGDKYKLENLNYDEAGNILTLRRYDNSGLLQNDFYYKYNTGTNQLHGRTYEQNDFTYNPVGSMTGDTEKGIESVEYNFLDLPEEIETGSAVLQYGYDDAAQRLFKKQDGEYETIYIRGAGGQVLAEYDGDGILKFWRLGSFGHKTKESGTPSYYYLKDHLGNIRVTVDQSGNLVTKDDYYPFGLQMGGLSYNAGNTNDRLKYSGKELDEEAGLSKYHFGWREYDAELGRWNVVDKLYFLYPGQSPYNYCLNSPMNLIDPDGLQTAGSPEEFPSGGGGGDFGIFIIIVVFVEDYLPSPLRCTPNVVVQGPIATLPVGPAPMISSPSWAIQAGNNRLNTSAIPGGPAGAPNTSSSFGGGGSFRGGGGGGGGVSAAGNKGNSSGTAPATNAASMVANYAAGASASAQLWMSDLAKGFNTNSNTFTRFNSIYNNLGIARKTFGRLGIAASAISIGFNYHAMQNWNLSPERFAYRTSGTLISILGAAYIGGQVGGPWGAIGGAGISTMFLLGESAYDAGSIFWNKVTDVTNRFYNDFSSQPWSIYGY